MPSLRERHLRPELSDDRGSPTGVAIGRSLNRCIVRRLVGVLVFALVFAQSVLAAYACPLPAPVAPLGELSCPGLANLAMPTGSSDLDPAQPNLCAAHCQSGQQHAEANPAPMLPPVWLASLYPLPPSVVTADGPAEGARVDLPLPVPSPPFAILHCCLRN